MADNFVQAPPDGGGKNLQTYMNTIGGNQVHAEVIALADKTGTNLGTTGDALNVAITNSAGITIGTLPANASFNLSQIVGTTADTNAGNATAGTLRTVIASNQPNVPIVVQGVPTVAVTGNVPVKGTTGLMDAAGQNQNPPGSELIVGGQFNTSPTTISSGNVSPLQLDSSGNLLTNIKTGTVTVGAMPANSSFNLSQVLGSTVVTAASGTQKVGISGATGAAMDASGQNVAAPANYLVTGAQFNTSPSVIGSGNVSPLQVDSSGNLLVNVKAGAAGNPAASATGSAPPASADYGGINVAGTLRGQTGVNPGGSIYATQIDLTSIGGTNTDTNIGNATAATLRTVIASNQPNVPVVVQGTATVAPTANSSFNLSQILGSTVVTAAAGSQRVGISGATGVTLDGTVAAGAAPTNALAVLTQYKNTQPAPSDTQTVAAQSDQAGNLRMTYGAAAATLAVWNSGTALNTTQNIFTNSAATAATIVLQQSSGTFSAGAITFEVTFDGTNWVAAPTAFVLDPTDANLATIAIPYTLVASTNKAFVIVSTGFQGLRIKLSTAITGTGTVTPVYMLMPEGPAKPITVASGGVGNNVNLNKVGGTAVSNVTAGLLDVNVKNVAGAAWQIGASGRPQVCILGNGAVSLDAPALSFNGNPTNNGLGVYGQFRQSPTTTASDDICGFFQLDSTGNLRINPSIGLVTGLTSWTTATALNTTQSLFSFSGTSGPSGSPITTVLLSTNAGTFTAGAITFEVTWDNTNWTTIPADCVLDPTSASSATIAVPYTLIASTNKPFLLINRGWNGLRIKLSTAITGSSSPTLTISGNNVPYSTYIHASQDFIKGVSVSTQVSGVQDVVPRKYDGATGLNPKYYMARITSKTTTYVTNSAAYVSVIKVACSNAGTAATMNIADQSGSGNITFAAPNFPGGNMTQSNYLEAYTEPLKCVGGIQIVTGGTTFGDCNVGITYWQ